MCSLTQKSNEDRTSLLFFFFSSTRTPDHIKASSQFAPAESKGKTMWLRVKELKHICREKEMKNISKHLSHCNYQPESAKASINSNWSFCKTFASHKTPILILYLRSQFSFKHGFFSSQSVWCLTVYYRLHIFYTIFSFSNQQEVFALARKMWDIWG